MFCSCTLSSPGYVLSVPVSPTQHLTALKGFESTTSSVVQAKLSRGGFPSFV